MKHIGCFSGGKDSTALMLWMRENIGVPGVDWTPVFCDTKWEHPITYAYIQQINQTVLNDSLVTLESDKYVGGMRQLVQIKGRVPSIKARFCTSELKVKPMVDWLRTINDEITVYQGIRADESISRSKMCAVEFSNDYDAWIERPLLKWTAQDCFDTMRKHGVRPNPLYRLGAGRVGCFPCVLISLRELKALMIRLPEIKERIVELEKISGRTFFPPNYIPWRFRSLHDPKSGQMCCTAEDVFRYIESVDENQLPLIPAPACMSVYNLCE